MSAAISTGLLKRTSCQPLAVSFVNVAVASSAPVRLKRCPTWVPVFVAPLKKRMPLIRPAVAERKRVPTSIGAVSVVSAAFAGVAVGPQMLHGHALLPLPAVTVTPTPGLSRLPLSSTARLRSV